MQLAFNPPGPVGAAFMASTLLVNSIMGPVGSGKTSCAVMKTIQNAAYRQVPSKLDGVRYTKMLAVRQTYKQLGDTTIPSWFSWIPKDHGKFSGDGSGGGSHHLRFRLPDQSIVDLQADFIALGEQNVEQMMRGREFNMLWLNEADTLVPSVLSQGLVRVVQGRYPGERHVDPDKCLKEVINDYNAPDTENYLYSLNEEDRPADYGFFRQPGGLSSGAENRQRATYDSYVKMEKMLLAQGRDDLARRMIHNDYGFTRDGKPVYPEYRDSVHCAGVELEPVAGLPIKISCDQGLHPAAIARQTLPSGRRIILAEWYCDSGAKGLAEIVKAGCATLFPGFRVIGGRCDPAGDARDGNDAESWIDAFNRHMGWSGRERMTAAETNKPDKLISAVGYFLMRLVDDGRPAIQISSRCRILRKGIAGEYRYKQRSGGDNDPNPIKKVPVSDIMNALETDCLDEGGYEEVVGREKRVAAISSTRTVQAQMEISI